MVHDVFLDIYPNIDLHGYDMESARVATNDFINDSIKLGYSKVVIIHGIGEGKVKGIVHDTLSKNKFVSSYKIDNFNIGCTIVEIKNNN